MTDPPADSASDVLNHAQLLDAGQARRFGLELSGERLALYEALFRRSERIARMYFGAHSALNDTLNPERFVLAAHAMRELMEKVPEIVEVSTPAHSERLGAKVAELEQTYHRALLNSTVRPPKWEGETDGPIRDLLENVEGFFEWKKDHMPRRRQEIANTIRALDGPAGRAVPADLEKLAVEEWLTVKEYFVNVAHHQTPDPTSAEFDSRLTSLERMLLGKLNPPTFADFDALDAIIKSGEASDG